MTSWKQFEGGSAGQIHTGQTNQRTATISGEVRAGSAGSLSTFPSGNMNINQLKAVVLMVVVTNPGGESETEGHTGGHIKGEYNWTIGGSVRIRNPNITPSRTVENIFTLEEISNQTFLKCSGYKDDRSRYRNGGEIAQADRVLKSPPDVIQALCRDEQIGSGLSTAEIKLPSFCAIRANTDRKLDFQLFSQMTKEDFSVLAQESNIHLISESGRLSAIEQPSWRTDPVFTLEDRHIIVNETTGAPAITLETTPQEELANEFFFKYGYNPITDQYEKFLIKTHVHTASGTGNIDHATKVLTDETKDFTALSISVGDAICFPTLHLATFITAITQRTLTLATGPSADQNNVQYFSGPYFNYDCYLSKLQNFAQDTGVTQEREQSERNAKTVVFKNGKIESKYIRDDRTMNAQAQSIIERFSLQLYRLRIDTSAVVEQLKRGDIITVNSRHITAAQRARKWMVENIQSVAVHEECQIRLIERRRAFDPFYTPPEILIENSQFTNAKGWTLPAQGSLIDLAGDNDFAERAAQLKGDVATFPSILSQNIDISQSKTYIFNIDVQKASGNREFRVRAIFKSATADVSTETLIEAQSPGA